MQSQNDISYTSNKQKHNFYIKQYRRHIEFHQQLVNEKKENRKPGGKKRFYCKYAVIYVDFLEILKSLSDEAAALYVVIGLQSNRHGYYSKEIEYFCSIFKRSEKTIRRWLAELCQKRLVYVKIVNDRESIYICPYNSDIQYCLEDDRTALTRKYRNWIKERKERDAEDKLIYHFSFVTDEFINFLGKLKTADVKLYIYCCLRMNLKEGYLTDALIQISTKLGFSVRKIEYSFKRLEAIGLICRHQLSVDSFSYTYIRPINFENDIS